MIVPQSLAQIYVHIVFSTKDRKPVAPWRWPACREPVRVHGQHVYAIGSTSPAIIINGNSRRCSSRLVRLSRKFAVNESS